MSEFNKNLWAPWRTAYLASFSDKNADERCFLCVYAAWGDHDAENLVVCRSAHMLVVMNRYPYTNGHLMIAPQRHVAAMEQLTDEELLDLGRLTRDGIRMLRAAVSAQGFNVGMNIERCAGAGLPGHLHAHIVPRWNGDTNFMFTVGDARVIPQSLEELFDRLQHEARGLGLA